MTDHNISPPPADDPAAGISHREALLGLGASAALGLSGAAFSAMPGHDNNKHAPGHGRWPAGCRECLSR